MPSNNAHQRLELETKFLIGNPNTIFLRILSCDLTLARAATIRIALLGRATAPRDRGGARGEAVGLRQEYFSRTHSGVSADKDARSLILYPIAARLGIGDALLLLIANRDSAEESRTTGFAGKQVALTVHQNGSLGCASGHSQYEGKDKYCSHKLKLNISASSVG